MHTLHSTRLLWTTPGLDWQMKHLNDYNNTHLSLQQWDWALSKDTLGDQYRPSVKNDCIDLGYLKLFYTLSLKKSSSCKYWRSRLNIENCTYFQCAARDGGSCCFGPCKNWEFIWHLFEVWLSAKLVDITDISHADRGYKAIHWVTCLLNVRYASAQENNI